MVRSANGCTVSQTLDDGQVIVDDVPAGKSTAVFAFASKLYIDDDSAVAREVFKLAPQQKLTLLGVLGGNTVPAWLTQLNKELSAMLDGSQFETAWLADEKKLVVHTDRVSDDMLAAVLATAQAAAPAGAEVVQYNHNIEVSWRDIDKYAECESLKEMYEVAPEKIAAEDLGWTIRYVLNDFTSDGDFVYRLTKLKKLQPSVGTAFIKLRIEKFKLELPSATNVNWAFYGISYHDYSAVKDITLIAPIATTAERAFADNAYGLRKIKAYLPRVTNFHAFNNSRNLEEVEGDFSSAENCKSMFEYTILNKKSALNVLTSIPSHASGSHPLTIGIHVDHQSDDEVLAAIANAEAKGWTLTVQWNGTPTAAASVTYGLRKPPIYAKVSEIELPDGTTERVLDWGHYVTDPSYEEFRSVEAAREYYGLPEEPLTETE